MGARHFYRDPSGAAVEVTAYVRNDSWTLESKAEEGAVGSCTIDIDDPSLSLDFSGHRLYWVTETEVAPGGDDVVWAGYTADQTVIRTPTAPLERTWRLALTDINTIWARKVMTGADCKRPAETDVQRIAWLLATDEGALFTDKTTYVDATAGVAMDAADYRGQMFDDVANDCAQASGRNWFASMLGPSASKKVYAFYRFDTATGYRSLGYVTDALANLDGGLFWQPSRDAQLVRDPSRVFSGDYLPYDGGAVYVQSAWTKSAYADRDTVSRSLNVKSKAKARARAARYLADMASQHERITASVDVPASAANLFREGMAVPLRVDWMPGYGGYAKWCRIVTRTLQTAGEGARYLERLEMVGTNLTAPAPTTYCTIGGGRIASTPSGYYPPINGTTTDASGNIWYNSNAADIFHDGWNFTNGPRPGATCQGFGYAAWGAGGSPDYAGTLTLSEVWFVFSGAGRIQTATVRYDAIDVDFYWSLYHFSSLTGPTVTQTGSLTGPGTIDILTGGLPADAANCYRVLKIYILGPGGSKGGFPGLTWTTT